MAIEAIDHLSQSDFHRLAEFIQDYSGIKMPPTKKSMVEGRLRRRVRATGVQTLTDYCRYLFDQGGLADEAVSLIDAVSTNKTDFFREPDHFRYLVEKAVPDLLAKRLVTRQSPLKVWSAACSVGAEPYTLAMVLSDLALSAPDLQTSIVATDICTEVLESAILGIYPEAMIAPVPMEFRQRYVRRAKTGNRDMVRIVPELRKLIGFGRLNLIETPYRLSQDMHIIFCRNILIYFDKPTQRKVLEQLCSHLRPGGYFFLGHSETLAGFGLPLRPVGTTIFQRV